MSENEERAKLKANRFKKLETSNSRTSSKDVNTSSDIPRRPHKRIHFDAESSSSNKKICYGLMHPQSNTVNLANNRMKRLKETLRADLINPKKPISINSDCKETNIYINDSLNRSNESQSSDDFDRGRFKQVTNWHQNSHNFPGTNYANDRLKRLRKVIENNKEAGIPKYSDSSGSPQKVQEQSASSSRHTNNSVLEKSSRSLDSPTSSKQALPNNHCSPLLRDKVASKRKISDPSSSAFDHIPAKQLLLDPHPYRIPKVRKPNNIKPLTITRLSRPHHSSRVLKIRNKTEEINNCLKSNPVLPISKILNMPSSNSKSPLNTNCVSNKGLNNLSTPTSQHPKLSRITHSNISDKTKEQNCSFVSPTRDSTNRYHVSNLKSIQLSPKCSLDKQKTTSIDNNSKTYTPHQLQSDKNSPVRKYCNPDSRDKLTPTYAVFSPQTRLTKYKSVAVEKSNTNINCDLDSLEKPHTSIRVGPIKLNRDLLNTTTEMKHQNPHNFKVNTNSILNQDSLSTLNVLLSDSEHDEKMAMTASWIRNHQQFASFKNEETTKADPVVQVAVNNDIDLTCDDMEWTNAEPEDTIIDTKKKVEPPLKEEKKHEETQTTGNMTNEEKDNHTCIVIDTNVFISHLSKIMDIVNLKITGSNEPLIYIPWMVVTELDELKDRPGDTSLKRKASDAIRYINRLLSEHNPRVKGQSISDMSKQISVGSNQDDKIMGTCLQATEKYDSVILLSNDTNLKNKAMVNEIAVASPHEIIMTIMSKSVKNTKSQKVMQKMSMLCSSIICGCAKEAYGDAWLEMDMMKNPPWSLLECMKRLQRYWMAVFQEKLMKPSLNIVNKLQQILSLNKNVPDDSSTYNEFIKATLDLCICLKDIEEYRGSVDTVMNHILKIS